MCTFVVTPCDPLGLDMGKLIIDLLGQILSNVKITRTLSVMWVDSLSNERVHTDTMTAGEIRTLAKIQKGILSGFVCKYTKN